MKRFVVICFNLVFVHAGLAELIAAAPLPNRWMPQGEMRLQTTTNEARIEVVLHTRFLDRVLRAITDKEKANWGADNSDAQRYVTALADARAQLKTRHQTGPYENLVIEFVAATTGTVVRLSSANVTSANETPRLRIEGVAPLTSFAPSPEYVRRNMALILADRLDLTPEQAEEQLQAHLPKAAAK